MRRRRRCQPFGCITGLTRRGHLASSDRRGDDRRRRSAHRLRTAGDGPPLVLLHGYVGDGPTTWRAQLEGLSDEFTVVAWDAPGAGRSSDPPERVRHGRLRRLPGRLHRRGSAWSGRTWSGCRSAARSPSRSTAGTPPSPADADAGVGLRRLGRLAAGRGRRAAPAPGAASLADLLARGVRRRPCCRRCSPTGRRRSPSTRSARACASFTRVGSAPWRRASAEDLATTAAGHRPDPVGVRRRRRAGTADRRRGSPRCDLRLDPRRAAGRRPRLQRRGARRVQHSGPGVFRETRD